MSKALQDLNQLFVEFEESPVGHGAELRLDLAEIIWRGLTRNKWTQRELAKKSGLADAVISNLVHGNKNCTLDTVGVVLHALGVKGKLAEWPVVDFTDGFTGFVGQMAAGTTIGALAEWNYGQTAKIVNFESGWIKTEVEGTEACWSSDQSTRDIESSYNMGGPYADFDSPRCERGDVAIFRVSTPKQYGRNVQIRHTVGTPKRDR